MNRKWLSIAALTFTAGFLLALSSCAHDRELIGITIQPQGFTFLNADSTLSANFSAIGTYLHPPETRDITTQVTWATDIPQLVSVTAGGVVSPTGNGCGVANVSASTTHGTGHSGNLVIAYATVTIDNPAIAGCPGGSTGPTLTVSLQANTTANATVTSSPTGINCPGVTCGAPFPTGTVVTLTASPSGSFASWGSCPSASNNVCTVALSADTIVTATFN